MGTRPAETSVVPRHVDVLCVFPPYRERGGEGRALPDFFFVLVFSLRACVNDVPKIKIGKN